MLAHKNVVVLVSGGGTNLQALIDAAGCDESDVIISEGGTLRYIPLGKG